MDEVQTAIVKGRPLQKPANKIKKLTKERAGVVAKTPASVGARDQPGRQSETNHRKYIDIYTTVLRTSSEFFDLGVEGSSPSGLSLDFFLLSFCFGI